MMRIIFFTNKTARGAEILKQLKERGIHIRAIFIDVQGADPRARAQKVGKTVKRIGWVETTRLVAKRVRKRVLRRKKRPWRRNNFYRAYAPRVYIVYDFNSKECERLLRSNEPDLVVLGGARILRRNIIAIPRIGILNAHPGLLPHYRGVDVIPWAVYNGDPVGVTIHFVDSGVDTGCILAERAIPLAEGDTLGSLQKKATRLAGELMANTVRTLIDQGQIHGVAQPARTGKQYYRMPLKLRREAERRLKKMIADSHDPKGTTHGHHMC